MIFSIRDLSFEFGSVLLEGWFALAARAGCALLILLAAWLVRRWLEQKSHYNNGNISIGYYFLRGKHHSEQAEICHG